MRLAAIITTVLLFTGCASTIINSMQFKPADPTVEMNQTRDEAECRMKFNEYRTHAYANLASGAIYRDCMIAKGYEEVE